MKWDNQSGESLISLCNRCSESRSDSRGETAFSKFLLGKANDQHNQQAKKRISRRA